MINTNFRDCCIAPGYESGFPSEQEFGDFKRKLDGLVGAGKFEEMGMDNSPEAFYHFLHKCANCGYVWRLSMPDQAYRGGFRKILRTSA